MPVKVHFNLQICQLFVKLRSMRIYLFSLFGYDVCIVMYMLVFEKISLDNTKLASNIKINLLLYGECIKTKQAQKKYIEPYDKSRATKVNQIGLITAKMTRRRETITLIFSYRRQELLQ